MAAILPQYYVLIVIKNTQGIKTKNSGLTGLLLNGYEVQIR